MKQNIKHLMKKINNRPVFNETAKNPYTPVQIISGIQDVYVVKTSHYMITLFYYSS